MNSLKNPSRLLVLLIALLVPILAVGAFTATLAQPERHLTDVIAAVVNNDEPVELEGQIVPLGRQLAAALVEGQGMGEVDGRTTNYTWVMTNDALARDGLRSGEYSAVVTIPPEFSEAATSTAVDDATPRQALVTVEMSPRARLADESLTHTIIRAAAASLGNELTGTYLDNIFLGFNTLGSELGIAADGAQQIADGVKELSSGAGQLADGTGALADGVGQLAGGTGQLAAGARELAGGAGELAGGLSELAGGMGEFAGGVGELSAGVGGLKAGTAELSSGAKALAEGASALATGSQEYAAGVDEFSAGLGEISGGAGELAGGLGELNEALSVIPPYLDQIESGIDAGAEGVRDLANELEGASGTITDIIAGVCAEDPDGAACQILSEYLGQTEDLEGLLVGVAAGLRELASYMDQATGEQGLGQIQQLFTGVDQLAGGAAQLAEGLELLHAGSQDLAGGAHGLAGGNEEIAAGLSAFAGGVAELDGGVGDLHTGVKELDDGATTLAGATGQLADGTRELAGGVGAFAGGVDELHAGTGELADGAEQLAAGTGELADGTAELSSGTGELADGLGQATDAIPNYPDGTRETLAEVIAEPMALDAGGGVGFRWLAFFSMVALWAGGLWLLAAYPAVAANARSSTRSPAALTLQAFKTPLIIAAAQGLGVGAIVGMFANVPASVALGFTLLAMLASMAFTAVQRGLVAWSGWLGIALTVLIAMLAIATAVVSAMPALATKVVSMLPVGPAIYATQALETTSGGMGGPLLGLATWGVAGVVAVMLATRRAQTR